MDISELQNQIKDPASLNDFQLIKDEAEQRIDYGNVSDKEEMMEYLAGIISDNGAKIQQSNAEMYDQYQTFWVMLAFKGFVALQQGDQDTFLEKRLLYAIQKGFNPDDLIKQFFNFYESEEFVKEQFGNFMRDLEQNVEPLGSASIEIEGKKYVPQMRYWLSDYSKFPQKVSFRGAVERLNFLNSTANSRSLTQSERQNLLTVLKFYDDLLHATPPSPEPKSRPAMVQLRQPLSPGDIDEKLAQLKARIGRK